MDNHSLRNSFETQDLTQVLKILSPVLKITMYYQTVNIAYYRWNNYTFNFF